MANEKRLIDSNEFLKECDRLLKNPPFVHPATPWDRGLQLAVETALRLPHVDAVEVVHGRWKDGHCTNCNHLAEVQSIGFNCTGGNRIDYKHTNYCPNCGAKMDGDGDG